MGKKRWGIRTVEECIDVINDDNGDSNNSNSIVTAAADDIDFIHVEGNNSTFVE